MSKKTNNMTLSTSILSESLSLFTPKDRAYNKAKKDHKDTIKSGYYSSAFQINNAKNRHAESVTVEGS